MNDQIIPTKNQLNFLKWVYFEKEFGAETLGILRNVINHRKYDRGDLTVRVKLNNIRDIYLDEYLLKRKVYYNGKKSTVF